MRWGEGLRICLLFLKNKFGGGQDGAMDGMGSDRGTVRERAAIVYSV